MRYLSLFALAFVLYGCSCSKEEGNSGNANSEPTSPVVNEAPSNNESEGAKKDTVFKKTPLPAEKKKTTVIRSLKGTFRDVRKRDDYYVVDVYAQNRLFTFAFKEEKTYNTLKKNKKYNEEISLKWKGREGVKIDGEPDLSGLLVELE
jgi:hypothetical protein